LRAVSLKRKASTKAARPIRLALIAKHHRCMVCGHSPQRPWRDKPRECSRLCCHEIANGAHRQKAMDKPYAILVVCWWCNGEVVTNKREWPEARQLALLQDKAPEDYDLAAYNALVGREPNRVTQEDVDQWRDG
jgi:hypothetical protein